MDFYEVLEQVLILLQRHGRVTYRALKVQFKLDDETLEALMDQLLFSHPVVDEAGRGLVWAGEPSTRQPKDPGGTEAGSRFHAVLSAMVALLQQQGRVSYRAFKREFGIDDDYIEDLKEEIIYAHPVVDDEGKGLIWTGDSAPLDPRS